MLVFLTVMSLVAAFTAALWSYVSRSRRFAAVVAAVLGITVVAVAVVGLYVTAFADLRQMAVLQASWFGAMLSLSWLLAFLLAFPVMIVLAFGTFIYRRFFRKHTEEPAGGREGGMSRRSFLQYSAAAVPLLAATTSLVGNAGGHLCLQVTSHDVTCPSLPPYLENYKIAQISDCHIGTFFSIDQLREAVLRAAGSGAQRLEITGDLIDELSLLPQCQAVLQELAPYFRDGIDFCYGNHEYYRGLPQITAMLEKTPVRILRNSSFRVQGLPGQRESDRPFYICGSDYSFAKEEEAFAAERRRYTEKALQYVPQNAFVLFLAHHPAFFDETFAKNIPLTLSGHTHGGQFALLAPLVQAVGFKYLRGMFKNGSAWGYVNRGTGHWLPFRFLCSREVSVFTLHRS